MTNLTRSSFLYIYFNSLHVSINPVFIIRIINFINTTSGMSLCVGDRFVYRSDRKFPTCTRNSHRHRVTYQRLILLIMSTGLLETCRELKYIYRKELCLKLAIYQETTFLFGAGSTERYETSWFSLHKQDCSFHSALKVINHFSKNLLLSSGTTWRIPVQNFT